MQAALRCQGRIPRRDLGAALHVKDIAVTERPEAIHDGFHTLPLVRRIGPMHSEKERGTPFQGLEAAIQYVEFETLRVDLDQVRIFQTPFLIEHADFNGFLFRPAAILASMLALPGISGSNVIVASMV